MYDWKFAIDNLGKGIFNNIYSYTYQTIELYLNLSTFMISFLLFN